MNAKNVKMLRAFRDSRLELVPLNALSGKSRHGQVRLWQRLLVRITSRAVTTYQ
jgi:hypothetical protein